MKARSRQELKRFLFVGSLTVLLDYFAYQLVLLLGGSTNPAKAIGFCIGTIFAYFANRFWTFSSINAPPGNVWKFCCIYSGNLGVNIYINAALMAEFNGNGNARYIAFFLATLASATLNFIGMKYIAFTDCKIEG